MVCPTTTTEVGEDNRNVNGENVMSAHHSCSFRVFEVRFRMITANKPE